MEDLAEEMWSMLPSELVERMLSFLPVPVLYRFRTVCKSWNSIICKPEFGALCIQHARGQEARFIVLREELGWSFLDVAARCWYRIERDERVVFRPLIRIDGVDMDGGLVVHHRAREASVFVSNPVAKTFRRLPLCTAITASVKPVVNMVVDNMAHNFKVLVIPNGPEGERANVVKPRMVIYESTTNQWRNSTARHTPLLGFPFRAICSIFLDGLLYVLMSPLASKLIAQQDCLWSYDHVEDVWKNTCVNIHNIRSLHYPQLIVSNGRLFLASWMQKPDAQDQSDLSFKTWPWVQDDWSYEIIEVHLKDRTCSTVFDMKEAGMRQILEVPEIVERRFSSVHLKAFGCCKSIVLFCMSTGMAIVYDLSTSTWELLPCKPLPDAERTRRVLDSDILCVGVGKPMNLILPVNTLWDQQHEI